MAMSYIRPAGGLPSAARALLTPENIRAGVHIKGGGVDVTGNVMPYTNNSGGIIGVICGFGGGDYGYGEPYFRVSGATLTCKIACNVSIYTQGQANSGASGQAYGYIKKNGATILTCKESYNWFSGSVNASFAPGDTLTISITGNDPKAMMVRVTLR